MLIVQPAADVRLNGAAAEPGTPRSVDHHDRGRQGGDMPTLIAKPAVIRAVGNKPKEIQEFAGRVNTGHADLSVARMLSPEGWREPGQRPEFQEITVVLRGMVRVDYEGGTLEVRAGQGVVTQPGEWVRYSTPEPGGAEYLAVCTPAFSPTTVHRDLE